MRHVQVLLLFAIVSAARDASADEPTPRPLALGFNLDLLPTVLSAANGKFGLAPQVWLGIDHVRIRFVAGHLAPPDAFAFAPAGFRRPTTTALAAIIDYTFGPRWDGWWVGAGVEAWQRSIQHDDVDGTARWTSAVFTVGGGHIWRFAGDFYVDPWIGAHAVLDPYAVTVGPYRYTPFPLQAEGSVKIGWFVSL